jgi:putative transposase
MTDSLHVNQVLEIGDLREVEENGEANDVRHLRVLHVGDGEVALFDLDDKAALPVWMPTKELAARWNVDIRPAAADDFAPDYSPDDLLSQAAKDTRKRRLKVIAPILMADEDGDVPILRQETRGQLVLEASAKTGAGKDKIYRWLRLWWRHGQIDNALLPDYRKCGRGPAQPGEKKRGRKLTVGKNGPQHEGIGVDAKMRALILKGARLFWDPRPGKGRNTQRQAYQLTLERFFHKRLEIRNGVLTPVVREGVEDDNRLPSFDQWKYHVEEALKQKGELARRYDSREFALRRRPVLGDSQHLSKGPGDLFLIDATVADLYLVSSYDRAWTIGRPVLYLVVDHYSRMIVGIHVALEGPNWEGAMMALASAFTDKVAFCKRHGIEIRHEDWPCDVAPARLTADRGEVISEHADYIVPGFRLTIHDTPPFRADFKSFVEGQFKITNERGIKRMPGWVDKLKERGGPDYRYDAKLTLHEFMKVMIELALHNNRTRPITSNLPLDLPLDEEGSPVPLELWDWGLANASPSLRRFKPAEVRRNLLPTYEAITTRQGLSTFGGRLHYTLPRGEDEGWFVRVPGRGGRKHKLAIDPWNVANAFLREANRELEPCGLTPADEKRFAGRTLADVEDRMDRGKRRGKADERKRVQNDADLHAKLESIKEAAAEEQRKALAAAGRRRPRITDVTQHREAERDVERLRNASTNADEDVWKRENIEPDATPAPSGPPAAQPDDDVFIHMPD